MVESVCCLVSSTVRRYLTSLLATQVKSNVFRFQSNCPVVVHSYFFQLSRKTGEARTGKKAVGGICILNHSTTRMFKQKLGADVGLQLSGAIKQQFLHNKKFG